MFCSILVDYYSVDHCLQNRLLAMNYINEGHDDKLFEAHRFQLNPFSFSCLNLFYLCTYFKL